MYLNRVEHRDLLRALRLEERIPERLAGRAEEHIKSCSECQIVLRKTKSLRNSLKSLLQASHPPAEDLLAYLTRETSSESRGAGADAETIRMHLQVCELCRKRAAHLQNEIKQVENIMQNAAEEMAFEQDYDLPPTPSPLFSKPTKRKFFLRPIPRATFPVAVACAVLLLVFFLSLASKPETYSLANLESDQLDVLPLDRGTLSDDELALLLVEGLINTIEYEKARKQLAEINEPALPQFQALRFRLCDLMLTLKSAHRSFVYLFPHFEKSQVQLGLQRMEAVLNPLEAGAPGNEAYWGLAHYYCAKAYLMLEDKDKALSHLQEARKTPHQRRHETDALLKALGYSAQ